MKYLVLLLLLVSCAPSAVPVVQYGSPAPWRGSGDVDGNGDIDIPREQPGNVRGWVFATSEGPKVCVLPGSVGSGKLPVCCPPGQRCEY